MEESAAWRDTLNSDRSKYDLIANSLFYGLIKHCPNENVTFKSHLLIFTTTWRCVLVYNFNRIQTEWTAINSAQHQWEVQRATQMREIERFKVEIGRKIEQCSYREMEQQRRETELQRQYDLSTSRIAQEMSQLEQVCKF